MRETGGCLVTRFQVARLACRVYGSTLTAINILSAFRKSGIYPFDRNVVSQQQFAPSTTFSRDCDDNFSGTSNSQACGTSAAVQFLEERGGTILKNVQKAKKSRNTLTKVTGGKPITEDEIVEKIKLHTEQYVSSNKKAEKASGSKPNNKRPPVSPKPSTSIEMKRPRTVMVREDDFDSSDGEDISESEKCVVCKNFSPDMSKRPYIVIVSWGQCDKCSGWVHLSFCTPVKVIRRGDTFLCPSCSAQ